MCLGGCGFVVLLFSESVLVNIVWTISTGKVKRKKNPGSVNLCLFEICICKPTEVFWSLASGHWWGGIFWPCLCVRTFGPGGTCVYGPAVDSVWTLAPGCLSGVCVLALGPSAERLVEQTLSWTSMQTNPSMYHSKRKLTIERKKVSIVR